MVFDWILCFNHAISVAGIVLDVSFRYLMLSSLVGFYSIPFLRRLTPKVGDTAMTKVIGNCVTLLILSSALPVLSRTLGQFKRLNPREALPEF